jgi:SAM-dependent methyltransferase
MAHRVCPWWLGYLLVNPLRRLTQSPAAILAPYLSEGMTVLEPGPGMGFFTLELARRVGPRGRVIALDVQPKMLDRLRRRARKAGVLDQIDARVVPKDGMALGDLAGKVDFALAFFVVHELPDQARFFAETAAALRPGAKILLAEPAGHVTPEGFVATLAEAAKAGLRVEPGPSIRRSQSAVLVKV